MAPVLPVAGAPAAGLPTVGAPAAGLAAAGPAAGAPTPLERLTIAAYRAGGAVAGVLPGPLSRTIAEGVGVRVARTPRLASRRALMSRHLQRVHGPGLHGAALDRQVDDAFASYARYWAESLRLPALSAGHVDARRVRPAAVDVLLRLGSAEDDGRCGDLDHPDASANGRRKVPVRHRGAGREVGGSGSEEPGGAFVHERGGAAVALHQPLVHRRAQPLMPRGWRRSVPDTAPSPGGPSRSPP